MATDKAQEARPKPCGWGGRCICTDRCVHGETFRKAYLQSKEKAK